MVVPIGFVLDYLIANGTCITRLPYFTDTQVFIGPAQHVNFASNSIPLFSKWIFAKGWMNGTLQIVNFFLFVEGKHCHKLICASWWIDVNVVIVVAAVVVVVVGCCHSTETHLDNVQLLRWRVEWDVQLWEWRFHRKNDGKRDKFSKGRNRKMRDHNLFTSALVPLNRSLFGMQGTA